ncbi:very short patch repair endonuclease [Mitsuaria sp. BK037]|uniref:very short patch repair endonuclease n=1 Tax=Mitsuaria sp. BK037 TaxID=2587122 RepID=UPI0016179374|nr:DNA mismatch endonuclease Vsr [Mitsuaria sp. BK037]
MTDKLSPERRSWLMSRVQSKNTLAELRVRTVAHRLGLRFRLHRKDLAGSPDLVFPKCRIAIFVHGCFWHRHPECPKASIPKSNSEFWMQKFDANRRRDVLAIEKLQQSGWRVEVIWECETRDAERLADRIKEIFEISSER